MVHFLAHRRGNGKTAEEQKLAECLSDAIYLSVPKDIRDEVYDLLDAEEK